MDTPRGSIVRGANAASRLASEDSAPRWPRLALAAGFVALAAIAAAGTGYSYRPVAAVPAPATAIELPADPKALQKAQNKLRSRQKQLQGALDRTRPRGLYIVIDQTQNRLFLKKDEGTIHEAVCSAGSGMVLRESREGGREWVFDTPRGVFRVRSKIENPVWKKPDWAFVEEGKPIPKDPSERFENGVLGEYALYFGDGFMIHGTLYERLLGRSVTHGCIRLGREDLREVFHAADIGTPIYIY